MTLEEVNNLLSFEHGDSMILYIRRADNQTISIRAFGRKIKIFFK